MSSDASLDPLCREAIRIGLVSAEWVAALAAEVGPDGSMRERLVRELGLSEDVVAALERGAADVTMAAPISDLADAETVRDAAPGQGPDGLQATLAVRGAAILDAEVTREHKGRYEELGVEMGRGGIGRVVVVRDRHLGREIARKELLSSAIAAQQPGGGMSAVEARFLREARVTGQLEHPSIVPVHELGRRPDGTLYYTMKLVRGRTLSQALREQELAVRLKLLSHYANLCNAIAYAHSRGVIHRDIKSANVMLGEFGETQVLDWGLAKVQASSDIDESMGSVDTTHGLAPGLTLAGSVLGTPAYMSPEQASGGRIDARSDVWALGVVLYEILTGDTPFRGKNLADLARQIVSAVVRAPHDLDPQVPAELSSVCLKALARDPADRYETALELAAEIESYQSGARVVAHEYTSWEHLRRFASKNRPALVAAILTVVSMIAAIVVATAFYASERSARAQAQEATRNEAAARELEHTERMLASYHIAQGVQERASRAASQSAWPAARIYAAAALLHNPACQGADRHSAEFAASHPEAWRLCVAAQSRYLQSAASSALNHQRTISADHKLMALALSPDGRAVAATGAGNAVGIWDARTGHQLQAFGARPGTATCLAYSPDGHTLAAGSQEGELRLWDAASGKELASLNAHTQSVESLAWSPDGALVASASQDASVVVWDARLHKQLVLQDKLGPVHAVAWSSSGDMLATAGRDKAVRLWDARTHRIVRTLRGHTGVIRAASFSRDGARLATASYDKTIKVWDTKRGSIVWTGHGFEDEVLSVAFSPDDRLVGSGSWGKAVRLWDAASGVLLTRAEGHDAPVRQVGFSPDGRLLASVGDDERLQLWSAGQGPSEVLASPAQGYVWAVRYAPQGRTIATAGADGVVRLWDAMTRSLQRELTGHTDLVMGLDFSRDGTRIASASYDKTLRLWDLGSGRELRALSGHDGPVRSVAWSLDGATIVTGSQDQSVGLWDAAKGTMRARLTGHGAPVRGVAISFDGSLVASAGNDGTVRLWDAATGAPRGVWRREREPIVAVHFSSDGRRAVTAGFDGAAALWDVETGAQRQVLGWHAQGVYDARFSMDEKLIATASDDRTAAIWEVGQPRPSIVFEASQSVVAIDIAPDGKTIAMGDGARVRMLPLDLSASSRSGRAMLREAESAAGSVLEGFELSLEQRR